MAGRTRRGTPISAGALVVVGVLTGFIVEVVSGYLEPLAEYRWAWLSALVVVTAGTVVLDLRVRKREAQPVPDEGRSARSLPTSDEPSSRPLFQVPPRPPKLESRPELETLVAALRAEATGAVGVTTALVGAGGFGKTSLALLACHDDRVREFFTGGIIWVTIGRDRTTAEVGNLLRGLCEALSRQAPQMTDIGLLAHHLADLLAGRGRMLVVVDDVWTAGQLEPFVILAERVRVLVTTRNLVVLPDGHEQVRVDALDDRVAAEVLTRGLPPMAEGVRRKLLALTGGWPLLLALVNGRLTADVASGAGVDVAARQAITRLEQAGPAALDVTDADQRSKAVKATIEYSTRVLQPQMRERLFELGIFREDTEIPITMVRLLWAATARMDPAQVQQTCETLAGLSLITLRWVDQAHQVVVLHDVVRAFLRSRDGLAQRRVEVNQRLIDQAGQILGIGDREWWRLPEGHFLWDHLAFHLAEGGRETQLAELMADVRWLLARMANGSPLALETDLSLSQDERAVATRRVIARAGHLLVDLDRAGKSQRLSESNRLAHLSVLPHIRRQLDVPGTVEGPFLKAKWPLPESRDSGLIRTLTGHTSRVHRVAIAPDGSWLASASNQEVRIWRPDGHPVARLTGHTGWVRAVAIAPDASWLASTSHNEVRIWTPDGHLVATLEGHTRSVNGVAIAPDGSWLASASDDQTVRIWRPDGHPVARLTGHTGWVRAVAIAPDASWLASTSHNEVRIWTPDGHLVATLEGHTRSVNGVAIAPDGSWLASASDDQTVRIWTPDGHPVARLTGHTGWVRAVAIAPDASWLASTSHNEVRIWTPDGHLVATLEGHTSRVRGVAIASDGSWLASASNDATVRIWTPKGRLVTVLEGHTNWVRGVAIAPDGSWLASASDDRTVRIWNPDSRFVATLEGHTDDVHGVAIAPDGSWLASASNDATVRIWKPDGHPIRTLTGHTGWVRAVAIARDGSWLASASDDRTVRIWKPDGHLVAMLEGHTDEVHGVAIAPDGSWLASASDDRTVRIWKPDGHLVAMLEGHTDWVRGVAIAPDGSWLASTSDDRTVRIWKPDGNLIATLTSHAQSVHGLAIAPDGSWLASASIDRTVRIWKPDGHLITTLVGHTDDVTGVAIAPDGSWLASTSRDRTVRIWRPDGYLVATLTGHTGCVRGVAIAPDGSWLASTSDDATVRIWGIGELTECAALVRLESASHSVVIAESGLLIAYGGTNVYAFEFSPSRHEGGT